MSSCVFENYEESQVNRLVDTQKKNQTNTANNLSNTFTDISISTFEKKVTLTLVKLFVYIRIIFMAILNVVLYFSDVLKCVFSKSV